jgi:hypothetical protein
LITYFASTTLYSTVLECTSVYGHAAYLPISLLAQQRIGMLYSQQRVKVSSRAVDKPSPAVVGGPLSTITIVGVLSMDSNIDDYLGWHALKHKIANRDMKGIPTIHEREVYWCSVGMNIGNEESIS